MNACMTPQVHRSKKKSIRQVLFIVKISSVFNKMTESILKKMYN